jgi:hypothetical protein
VTALVLTLLLSSAGAVPPAGALPEKKWSCLPSADTLDVLFKDKYIGFYTHSVAVDEKQSTIAVETHLTAGDGTQGTPSVKLDERRSYGLDGNLKGISQTMDGATGIAAWHLIKSENGAWRLSTNTGGSEQVRSVPAIAENLNATASLYGGIRARSIRRGWAVDDTMYDPMSALSDNQEFLCREEASPENGGVWTFAVKSSVLDREEIWKIDTAGHVVYQEMFPFVAWKKNVRPESNRPSSLFSLIEALAVPASRPVRNHEAIAVHFDSSLAPDSSVRPLYHSSAAGWVVGRVPQTCTDAPLSGQEPRTFTNATATMQSDDGRIKQCADSLVKGERNRCDSIAACNDYVFSKLEKRYTPTFSNALETLKAGYGDCGEHAVLLGALLRAVRIPARVVIGLVYVKKRKGYYYHAWVMAGRHGSWVFADPALGMFPAFRDRVPLVIDDTGTEVIKIAKLIGRIKIDYVKTE